ncbi:Oxysterol-binding protein-related protein [Drosera capensis]
MVAERKDENTVNSVVLTAPYSSEGDTIVDYSTPNICTRLFSLLKNVRPGSDVTRFQLPPIFNVPKSLLQCNGESIYCVNQDMLGKCAEGNSPLERMIRVVAWSISTVRPAHPDAAPLNPILGETHHVSRGTLNVLLEQVSHHPPVTALHATDDSSKIELVWCQNFLPKFQGTGIETEVHSKRKLYLLEKGEFYQMNFPNLMIKLFPVPGCDWAGNVKIKCKETGLEAELCYKPNSLFSFGSNKRSIKGKIIESSSSKVLHEISGHWDRTVNIKDTTNGKVKVIYDASQVIFGLRAPTLKNEEEVSPSESAAVWADVCRGIITKDWDKAREAKTKIEQKERELVKTRKANGEMWSAKHFNTSYSKRNGWDCSPKSKYVLPAPIIYSA